MFEFLLLNLGTIIISAVILFVVALILANIVKKKKNGETSCGCGCGGCAMKDSCKASK